MRVIYLKKKSGALRTIYAPNKEEKKLLVAMVPRIEACARLADKAGISHGFMRGRSAVTNAMMHSGYRFSLSFDLEDWFSTVTREHIHKTADLGWPWNNMDVCFIDGAARQGLPTSPALANLAAIPMDREILSLNWQGRFGRAFQYSRYADDMTFSFSLPTVEKFLRREIPPLVERHGFKINAAKTRLQWAGAGRRIITGIAVDDSLHPTRHARRRLRAIQHQLEAGIGDRRRLKGQAAGLAEWMKLRLPNGFTAPKPAVPPNTSPQPRPASGPLAERAKSADYFMRKFA